MRGSVAVLLVLSLLATGLLASSPARAGTPTTLPPLAFGSPSGSPPPLPLDSPWSANVQVSEDDTPGSQNEITIAVASDGRIHMGWNDARQPNPDYRCGYSHSTDGGVTWSPNVLFHKAGWEADGDPVLVVDSSNAVYFVCMAFNRSSFSSQIWVYKSTDGGVSWSGGTLASDTSTGLNDKPWAFVAGNTIHLCYANFGVAPNELRYTRSTDGGLTWAPTRVIDRNGNGCVFALDGTGTLHLAWSRGGGIYAFRSANDGVAWSSATLVGPAPFTGAGDQRAGSLPMIAADRRSGNPNVYVVWTANDGAGSWDVRFARSTNSGVTWSPATSVNDVITNRQFMPAIGVDGGGVVHASWYDNRTGQMTYRSAYSTDAGQSWSSGVRVTDTEWVSTYFIGDYTALVVDAFGFVNCGWSDFRTGSVEAFFSRRPPFSPPLLTQIDVTPPEAWTDADTSVAFGATGFDQYGQVYPTNPVWQATGGTVAGGVYTPQSVGDWTVWANESGVSGAAVVHVSPGALARI
ncbi:MAG TPA: sialidase family protein, partial [Thermoplasmata archaeon]|nr:sialidase family protein [Thermoplasmata archaeon]